jgi:proteasome accessory factor A
MLRKMHYLLYLASAQVSSIVFTGQGKVGSENGRPPANFQLSQRADFYECLMSSETTVHRPLVNSRDESLCNAVGRQNGLARLHCIFYDNTLCHVSSFLKVGVMQILLAQIEAEDADAGLALEDPLEALQCWSRDLALNARARVVSGQDLTAVELQWRFLERAQRFCDRGACDGIVPGANKILKTWESVLQQLEARDLDALASRVDWVLKFGILDGVLSRRPQLGWDSPQIKHLDHLYSSLNPEEGLYWAFERSGRVEQMVTDSRIEHFVEHAPEDTRAWTRAMLLKRANGCVSNVDWDSISFRVQNGAWSSERTIALADPTRFTRVETEPVFKDEPDLDCMLDRLAVLQESEDTFVGR